MCIPPGKALPYSFRLPLRPRFATAHIPLTTVSRRWRRSGSARRIPSSWAAHKTRTRYQAAARWVHQGQDLEKNAPAAPVPRTGSRLDGSGRNQSFGEVAGARWKRVAPGQGARFCEEQLTRSLAESGRTRERIPTSAGPSRALDGDQDARARVLPRKAPPGLHP